MKKYELDYNKLKVGVNVLKRDVLVYKKLGGAVCQLYLPKGTRVMKSAYKSIGKSKNKLRCDGAIVVMIVPIDSFGYYNSVYKKLDRKTYKSRIFFDKRNSTYRLGKEIKPDGFDTNIDEACGNGIHFFCELNRAENY